MAERTALALPDPGDDSRAPVPADTSFEIALDPEPGRALPVPVDLPEPPGELLPVIPGHLQTRAGVEAAVRRCAARQWHRAKYHGIRSPRYLALAVAWAVVGVIVLTGRWLRWWLRPVPLSVHADAVAEGHRAFKSVFGMHLNVTRARAQISLAVAAPVTAAVVFAAVYGPWWWWLPLIPAVLVFLARAGHPADKPIIRPAVVLPRFRVLNADVVLRAYYAAVPGCSPDKPGQQVTFGSTMARDGEGSRVVVDMPYGLGLKDAIASKPGIASGLDVTESQVFLHRDPTSARRHTLWVADRDPLAVPVGRTPLLACRATDIWRPAPMGLDERGQMVGVPLMWHSVLVGALPRQGKSWTARLLALFAALDPFVRLDVFDASGKPDWRKFALVADSCAFGLTPTRHGLPPEMLLATLQAIKKDVEDRYARLSQLPTDVCPQGKLTRAIARDPRFRMPVRGLILDEVQEYFDLGPISAEIAALLVYLVKVAPGAGVWVIDATQRPSGIGTGDVGRKFLAFRDNHQVRFSLRTSDYRVSEMVLGAGSIGEGLDSSKLLPEYKGVGILRGVTDASPTVRCHYAGDPDAERILLAARALRERAGTLSGMALGEEVSAPARDVLGDVLAVFGGDPGLHWQVLAARLAKRFPERWEDATPDSVSADLRALGVESVNVKAFGRVLRGCRREDAERAAAG